MTRDKLKPNLPPKNKADKRSPRVSLFQISEGLALGNLLILFVSGLLFWTSITSMLPTLPSYVKDLGGTTQQVGWVMGAFAIGLLGSRTLLGNLADSHSRKIVLLIGSVVGGLAPLGYLGFHAIGELMAIRAFHGISIAAFTTGYSAMIVDLSPVKQRGEIVGYMSLTAPIGMALGPALGSLILEQEGYQLLFINASVLGFLSLLCTSRVRADNCNVKKQLSQVNSQQLSQSPRSFLQILLSPALNIPTLIMLLIGLVFGALTSFLPLYLRYISIDFGAGTFYSSAAIASFLARFISGRASDRYGRGVFITLSLLFYTVSMILLAMTRSPQDFLLAAILEGAGAGVLIPTMITLISDRSHSFERGRVYAICIGGFDLGIAIAGPLLGNFGETGYRSMFLVTAALGGMATMLFLTLSNHTLISSIKFGLGRGEDHYAIEK